MAYHLSEHRFISFEGGVILPAFGNDNRLYLQAAYLWRKSEVFSPKNPFLDMYYGFGLKTLIGYKNNDHSDFGPRQVFGFMIPAKRFEFFGDLALTFLLSGQVSMSVDIVGGLRFRL